jgi:hypothetical protein
MTDHRIPWYILGGILLLFIGRGEETNVEKESSS